MFKDRYDAAKKLSTKLMDLYNNPNLLVLGISVGGMVVAHEVARQLNAQSDMLTVRKLRVPEHETEPMGAIAMGGDTVFNRGIIEHFKISQDTIAQVEQEERIKLESQENRFRGQDMEPLRIKDRVVLLVDDGMGTGATMRAAVDAMIAQSAKQVIVASPVSSPQVCMMFHGLADRTVCLATPQPFGSVQQWYVDFDKPSDKEVRRLIREVNPLIAV